MAQRGLAVLLKRAGFCGRAPVRAGAAHRPNSRKVSKSRSGIGILKMHLVARGARLAVAALGEQEFLGDLGAAESAVMAVVSPPVRAEIPEKWRMAAPHAPRTRLRASENIWLVMGEAVGTGRHFGPFPNRGKRGTQCRQGCAGTRALVQRERWRGRASESETRA